MAVVAGDLVLYEAANSACPDNETSTCGGAINTGSVVDGNIDEIFATIAANTAGGATKTRYAKVFYKNTNSSTSLTNTTIWVSSAEPSGNTWSIGTGSAVDTTIQSNAPAGVSFTAQDGTTAGALSIGTLANGATVPIWLKVELAAGTAPSAANTMSLRIQGNTA